MQAYDLKILEQAAPPARTVNFEASDDAAAVDLVLHYYRDLDVELWRGERRLQTFLAVERSS